MNVLNALILRTFLVSERDHSEGRRDYFLLVLKGSLIITHEFVYRELILGGVLF